MPFITFPRNRLRSKGYSSRGCFATVLAAAALAAAMGGPYDFIRPADAEPALLPYIGECWMEEDGTIRMFLRAETHTNGGTIVGHALREYRPADPDYRMILEHVGPMHPGDRRPVPAWPD